MATVSVSFRASSRPFTRNFVRNGVASRGRGEIPCSQHASTHTSELQVEHISSVQNKYVKHCVKLRTSASYRSETGRLLLAGATVLVEQFRRCAQHPPEILTLFLDSQLDKNSAIPDHIVSSAYKVVTVDSHVMKKLAGVQDAASIGAVAEMSTPQGMTEQKWQHARRVLVLDRVQDPGNLGTLLRNAEALNWDAVYLLDGCCDVFNEKAIRAARGATFTVSVSKGTWQEFHSRAQEASMLLLAAATSHSDTEASASVGNVFEDSSTSSVRDGAGDKIEGMSPLIGSESGDGKGSGSQGGTETIDVGNDHVVWTAGAIEPDISSLFEQLESRKVALVLGSEGQGLRPEILKECRRVSIPMVGETESLNVAAAGSMLMLVLSQSLKGVLQRVHGAMHA